MAKGPINGGAWRTSVRPLTVGGPGPGPTTRRSGGRALPADVATRPPANTGRARSRSPPAIRGRDAWMSSGASSMSVAMPMFATTASKVASMALSGASVAFNRRSKPLRPALRRVASIGVRGDVDPHRARRPEPECAQPEHAAPATDVKNSLPAGDAAAASPRAAVGSRGARRFRNRRRGRARPRSTGRDDRARTMRSTR